MNFIFISLHFPKSYWLFCQGLKNNGVSVLATAGTPYNSLSTSLKNPINDSYQVSSSEDYDEILRAVVWSTYKHGKTDWIESNNKYWLRQDTVLRRNFHVETGFPCGTLDNYQSKHRMKEFFVAAGLKIVRWQLTASLEDTQEFTGLVGYPVVIKSDIGVGTSDTHKIKDGDELRIALTHGSREAMIMEEYISGSYFPPNGITDSKERLLFVISHQYMDDITDAISEQRNVGCCSHRDIPADIMGAGTRSVEALDTHNGLFHFEFFRLPGDQPVGKKGDITGLEVNMCPLGGFLSDMISCANNRNVYQLWTDMIVHDTIHYQQTCKYSSGSIGRGDRLHYAHTTQSTRDTYRDGTLMIRRLPAALATAIGDEVIVARFKTEEKILDFFHYVQEQEIDKAGCPFFEKGHKKRFLK